MESQFLVPKRKGKQPGVEEPSRSPFSAPPPPNPLGGASEQVLGVCSPGIRWASCPAPPPALSLVSRRSLSPVASGAAGMSLSTIPSCEYFVPAAGDLPDRTAPLTLPKNLAANVPFPTSPLQPSQPLLTILLGTKHTLQELSADGLVFG